MGESGPFHEDDYYEEKGPNDVEFHANWNSFEESLRKETRFFGNVAQSVLDEVFADLSEHKVHDGDPVIVEAGPGKTISSLVRARVFQSVKKLEEAMMRPDLHIGPPPFELALPGRMNAHGISMFYGATNFAIALNEVRPPVHSHVLMGQFNLLRPIRLLNVDALSAVSVKGSIFDSGFIRQLERAKFLRYVSSRIARVVMPDDQPFEYLITQAIADYLANRTDLELDGIIYPSAQCAESGMNVVLFQKSSRVEEMSLPEGTKLSADLYTQDSDGYAVDPHVWEETPPPPKEGEVKKKAKAKFGFGDYFSNMKDADPDLRQKTLQLDLTSVKVHEIDSVKYKTDEHDVTRYRHEAKQYSFIEPPDLDETDKL